MAKIRGTRRGSRVAPGSPRTRSAIRTGGVQLLGDLPDPTRRRRGTLPNLLGPAAVGTERRPSTAPLPDGSYTPVMDAPAPGGVLNTAREKAALRRRLEGILHLGRLVPPPVSLAKRRPYIEQESETSESSEEGGEPVEGDEDEDGDDIDDALIDDVFDDMDLGEHVLSLPHEMDGAGVDVGAVGPPLSFPSPNRLPPLQMRGAGVPGGGGELPTPRRPAPPVPPRNLGARNKDTNPLNRSERVGMDIPPTDLAVLPNSAPPRLTEVSGIERIEGTAEDRSRTERSRIEVLNRDRANFSWENPPGLPRESSHSRSRVGIDSMRDRERDRENDRGRSRTRSSRRDIDAAHVEELRQELDRLTKLSGLELDQDLTPGLHQMFKHLVKPIAVLNDPDKRELDEERERVVEHIAEITPNNVRQALNASLLATEEGLREYVLEAVMDIRERSRLELDEVRNSFHHERKLLKTRLERLEENEKLTNRITTEKKDSITPNASYPVVGAEEDLVRKGNLVLTASMKVVEKKVTFDKEPYNYILHLCLESNKVAISHKLNQPQQRAMILSHIPSSEPEYSYLDSEPTLSGIFAIVSVMSNRILTISEIEKRINAWTLDNSSDNTLYKSVTTLIDLLRRSLEHGNGHEPIKNPELFRQAITRIQRDKLPKIVYDNLNEARIRIRDTDSIPELTRTIVGALNRYIGMKTPKSTTVPTSHKVATVAPVQKVYALEYHPKITNAPAKPSPPTQTNSGGGKGGVAGKKDWKDKKPQAAPSKPPANVTAPKKTADTQGTPKKPFKKFHFLKAWPADKPYLSKNGNKLSAECEKYFEGFCFRCGHNSHTYDKCRVYTDKTVCLSLCKSCMQGFHETCRRKWVQGETMAKQIQAMQYMYPFNPYQMQNSPYMVMGPGGNESEVEN